MYIILQKSHIVTNAKCLLNIQNRGVVCFKGSHPKIFFLVGSEACDLSTKVISALFKKP